MAIIRIYEDDKTTIKVSESDGYFFFSFNSGETYIINNDENEEGAIKLFNKSLRAYLAILDRETDEKVIRDILANFGI